MYCTILYTLVDRKQVSHRQYSLNTERHNARGITEEACFSSDSFRLLAATKHQQEPVFVVVVDALCGVSHLSALCRFFTPHNASSTLDRAPSLSAFALASALAKDIAYTAWQGGGERRREREGRGVGAQGLCCRSTYITVLLALRGTTQQYIENAEI